MIKVLIVASIIFGIVFSVGLSADNLSLAQMADDLQIVSEEFFDGLALFGLDNPAQDISALPVVSSSTIEFKFEKRLVDDNPEIVGDEHYLNLVSECGFHSPDSIDGETCIVCTLTDLEGNPLGSGEKIFTSYKTSDTEWVPITDVEFEGQNSVFTVEAVEVKICDVGEGCSVLFWSTLPPAWNNLPQGMETVSPDSLFSEVFGLDAPLEITVGGDPVPDPTLLQALNADPGVSPINGLVPQAVAALLNSQSEIDFNLTSLQVVGSFYGALTDPDNNDPGELAIALASYNDLVCPLIEGDKNNGARSVP